MKRLTTIAASGLLAASLALNTLPGLACGPFFDTAMFNYKLHPGLPLSSFLEGSIGVVRPKFARSYLVVAYRYLSNKPLTRAEQDAAMKLWKRRLLFDDYLTVNSSVEKWKEARAKVTDSKIDIEPYGSGSDYYQYLRVTSNSFETAIDSLERITAKYGIKSKEVSDWLSAQDIVFSEGKTEPEALPDDAPEYAKNEREYQMAAFNFYRKKWDQAIDAFKKIAENKKSRWRTIAPYLVARAYIRKSQLQKDVDRNAMFGKAKDQLEAILKDDSKSSLHTMSKMLLQYVVIRKEPIQTLNKIGTRIASAKSPETFETDLTDMTKIFDDIELEQNPDDKNAKKPAPPEFDSDLAEWVWTFNSYKKENLTAAVSKWRNTKSDLWLICSMALASKKNANLNSKDLNDLLKAAESIGPESPGYHSVSYYAVKLLNEKGDIEKASKITDSILANSTKLSRTTVNLFKNLKLQQLKNLSQLIELIPRVVAGDDFVSDFEIPEWFFSNKETKDKKPNKVSIEPVTADLLNTGLPVNALVQITESKSLPVAVQKNLVPAVWLRAVLLNRVKQAIKLSYKVESLIPQLKKEMVSYRSAKNPKQRKFLAIYTALRNPGLRPYVTSGYSRREKINQMDSYRDNWWGKGEIDVYYGEETNIDSGTVAKIARRILDDKQIVAANKEYKELVNLGTAPNYLANEIISYAKVYPNDSHVPEALHRAVKATRYGTTDDNTTSFSKACFKLLHKKYKNSAWTKQTPYYY